MRRALRAALVALVGCQVYNSSLLLEGGAPDVAVEACATMCGPQCVDLETDQNHCGSCDQTCEVGCAGGLCKPTVLAMGLGAPHGLVVTGGKVYVANSGSIDVDVMSSADGMGLKHFADAMFGVVAPDRLATDGTNLFWTDDLNIATTSNGAVYFGALDMTTACASMADGGVFTYCYDVKNLPSPYAIAVQGTTMFFTTVAGMNNSANGCATNAWVNSVLSCPTTGCATNACNPAGGPSVIASGQTQLASVAVDSQNVYWADFGGKEVRFCPQPGCTGGQKTFASGLQGPFDVITNGTTVYFSDRAGGALYSCPTSGCGASPKLLANNLKDPLLLATDGVTLYATLYQGGALVACTLPDCAGGAVTLASGLHAPYGVATDSTYVYWGEEGSAGALSIDGTVSKLRKN